jgi:hypothetical protein
VGQSRRFRDVRVTSAYAPRAATKRTWKHFAFAPHPDIDYTRGKTKPVMPSGPIFEHSLIVLPLAFYALKNEPMSGLIKSGRVSGAM